jgi:hypothetical protein
MEHRLVALVSELSGHGDPPCQRHIFYEGDQTAAAKWLLEAIQQAGHLQGQGVGKEFVERLLPHLPQTCEQAYPKPGRYDPAVLLLYLLVELLENSRMRCQHLRQFLQCYARERFCSRKLN